MYRELKENKPHGTKAYPYTQYFIHGATRAFHIPVHWHDEVEIIYIKKGKGTVTLDFESHYVEAGDIIIVVPGQTHGISQLNDYSMEYENIFFEPDMFISKLSDGLETSFFIPLLSGDLIFNHIITRDDNDYTLLADCLNRADNLCSMDFPKGYELAIKGYMYEFFFHLNNMCEESSIINVAHNKRMDKIKDVIKYIEENYQHPISIDEIADVCNFSSSHFMKYFKKVMGTSFTDYLNEYRLSMASRLLLSSSDNILEIAAECGYDNLSYFNRLFKKKYGVTPSAYRNK
jgi:AraC-like DNA-binding protein